MLRRATFVGTPTGGQPLMVQLHGGVSARVCTKWDRFPDGTEFVGVGVKPDVVVERTRRDPYEGRDPVLARALEIVTAK